jgi:hypothetical protein
MNSLVFFSHEQGELLIRLLIAQFVSDFLLQTNTMAKNKSWLSKSMFAHITIVYLTSALFSGLIYWSLVIAFSHWIIDSSKAMLEKKASSLDLFVGDQLLHIAVIILIWANYFHIYPALAKSLTLPFWNFKVGLITLGYIIAVWPIGYLIGFATQHMAKKSEAESKIENEKTEHGGKLIGQFERIIILTFVLLQQYEAIGFLITGKSIIRFAQKDENLRSEYVLVGTMMSYGFSILCGVLINWLISIS